MSASGSDRRVVVVPSDETATTGTLVNTGLLGWWRSRNKGCPVSVSKKRTPLLSSVRSGWLAEEDKAQMMAALMVMGSFLCELVAKYPCSEAGCSDP